MVNNNTSIVFGDISAAGDLPEGNAVLFIN
jgi:hypothetical protein